MFVFKTTIHRTCYFVSSTSRKLNKRICPPFRFTGQYLVFIFMVDVECVWIRVGHSCRSGRSSLVSHEIEKQESGQHMCQITYSILSIKSLTRNGRSEPIFIFVHLFQLWFIMLLLICQRRVTKRTTYWLVGHRVRHRWQRIATKIGETNSTCCVRFLASCSIGTSGIGWHLHTHTHARACDRIATWYTNGDFIDKMCDNEMRHHQKFIWLICSVRWQSM